MLLYIMIGENDVLDMVMNGEKVVSDMIAPYV
jgi:hypothetical protein